MQTMHPTLDRKRDESGPIGIANTETEKTEYLKFEKGHYTQIEGEIAEGGNSQSISSLFSSKDKDYVVNPFIIYFSYFSDLEQYIRTHVHARIL